MSIRTFDSLHYFGSEFGAKNSRDKAAYIAIESAKLLVLSWRDFKHFWFEHYSKGNRSCSNSRRNRCRWQLQWKCVESETSDATFESIQSGLSGGPSTVRNASSAASSRSFASNLENLSKRRKFRARSCLIQHHNTATSYQPTASEVISLSTLKRISHFGEKAWAKSICWHRCAVI